MSGLLIVIGFVLLVVYFTLFWLTMRSAGEEAVRYKNRFAGSWKSNLFGALLLVAALLAPGLIAPIILAIAAFAWMAVATARQHAQMRRENFSRVFERRLLRTSFLSPIAVAFVLGGTLWSKAF
jgi:membrane-anchored glycerophosphoryl diester phosphodiesterase (GDPDase)